jgi:hypothetical protein
MIGSIDERGQNKQQTRRYDEFTMDGYVDEIRRSIIAARGPENTGNKAYTE